MSRVWGALSEDQLNDYQKEGQERMHAIATNCLKEDYLINAQNNYSHTLLECVIQHH